MGADYGSASSSHLTHGDHSVVLICLQHEGEHEGPPDETHAADLRPPTTNQQQSTTESAC